MWLKPNGHEQGLGEIEAQQFEIEFNYSEARARLLLMSNPVWDGDTFVQHFPVSGPGYTVGATTGSTRSVAVDTKRICAAVSRQESLSDSPVYSDPSRVIAVSFGSKFDAVADSESAALYLGSSSRISTLFTTDVRAPSMIPTILRAFVCPRATRGFLLPES